jgi:hypothetical protein
MKKEEGGKNRKNKEPKKIPEKASKDRGSSTRGRSRE